MKDYIARQIAVARTSYEQTLRRFDDKARQGVASGALTTRDVLDLRDAAWGVQPESMFSFADVYDAGGDTVAAEPAPLQAPASEARAVAEGEDL